MIIVNTHNKSDLPAPDVQEFWNPNFSVSKAAFLGAFDFAGVPRPVYNEDDRFGFMGTWTKDDDVVYGWSQGEASPIVYMAPAIEPFWNDDRSFDGVFGVTEWVKPATRYRKVTVMVYSGGNAGGDGAVDYSEFTTNNGGAGGGSGALAIWTGPASLMRDREQVVVGAQGRYPGGETFHARTGGSSSITVGAGDPCKVIADSAATPVMGHEARWLKTAGSFGEMEVSDTAVGGTYYHLGLLNNGSRGGSGGTSISEIGADAQGPSAGGGGGAGNGVGDRTGGEGGDVSDELGLDRRGVGGNGGDGATPEIGSEASSSSDPGLPGSGVGSGGGGGGGRWAGEDAVDLVSDSGRGAPGGPGLVVIVCEF